MTTPTPDREALLALADRCEKAEGPDRELDERIGMAIGLKNTMRVGHECLGTDRVVPVRCPAYTASLDAAMTLVPESKNTMDVFSLELWTGAGIYEPHVRASAWVPGAPRVFAATSALALTAAALKARALAGDRP